MDLTDNNLIAALQARDSQLIGQVAAVVELKTGHVIYEPGDLVRAAYFPLGSAVASFDVVLSSGMAVETAMIGREGAVGGIVSDGNLGAYARACVHHGGHFARIASCDLDAMKCASPAIRNLFARYADCLLAQIFQSVACNAAHSLEERAARWLGASAERTGLAEIVMTQDQLGSILGIGRSYASRLLGKLREEGLIKTRRGSIQVLDPCRLRARACDCDEQVRAHFDEVMSGIYPKPLAPTSAAA